MSNFKSAERIALCTRPIPELYNTKLPINRINSKMQECTLYVNIFFICHQNIANNSIRFSSSRETSIERTQFSLDD